MNKIPQSQWIEWAWATLVAAVLLVSFVYTTFSTKSEATEVRNSIEKRLDRLDEKLDTVIFQLKNK